MDSILQKRRFRAPRVVGLAMILAAAAAPAVRPSDPAPRLHQVDVRDFAFQPPGLRVARGDTVVWINHDIVPHTVTSADAGWDSGPLPAGGTFTRVAGSPGTVPYVCRYHAGMTGSLTVRRTRDE